MPKDTPENAPEAPAEPAETPSDLLLTRAQAARRMRGSIATVRRMERTGELSPIVIDGRNYFSIAQVEKYARTDAGELAALAFQAFKDGKSAFDVVIELKQPPEVIENLHAAWIRMTQSIVLSLTGRGSWRAWESTYRLGPLTPTKLCAALEIVASNEEMRTKLVQRMEQVRQRLG